MNEDKIIEENIAKLNELNEKIENGIEDAIDKKIEETENYFQENYGENWREIEVTGNFDFEYHRGNLLEETWTLEEIVDSFRDVIEKNIRDENLKVEFTDEYSNYIEGDKERYNPDTDYVFSVDFAIDNNEYFDSIKDVEKFINQQLDYYKNDFSDNEKASDYYFDREDFKSLDQAIEDSVISGDKDYSDETMLALAKNTWNPDLLESIYEKTESEEVFQAIVKNTRADLDLIERVAEYSSSPETLNKIASLDNITDDIKQALANNESFGKNNTNDVSETEKMLDDMKNLRELHDTYSSADMHSEYAETGAKMESLEQKLIDKAVSLETSKESLDLIANADAYDVGNKVVSAAKETLENVSNSLENTVANDTGTSYSQDENNDYYMSYDDDTKRIYDYEDAKETINDIVDEREKSINSASLSVESEYESKNDQTLDEAIKENNDIDIKDYIDKDELQNFLDEKKVEETEQDKVDNTRDFFEQEEKQEKQSSPDASDYVEFLKPQKEEIQQQDEQSSSFFDGAKEIFGRVSDAFESFKDESFSDIASSAIDITKNNDLINLFQETDSLKIDKTVESHMGDNSYMLTASLNQNTHEDTLLAIAKDNAVNADTLEAVANNKNASADALEIALSKADKFDYIAKADENGDVSFSRTDEGDKIRIAVAGNSNTPESELSGLSTSDNRDIRAAVAGNESTHESVQRELSVDSDDKVRSQVAITTSSASLLKEMANDVSNYNKESQVLVSIANNEHTTNETLAYIATSDDIKSNEAKEAARDALNDRGVDIKDIDVKDFHKQSDNFPDERSNDTKIDFSDKQDIQRPADHPIDNDALKQELAVSMEMRKSDDREEREIGRDKFTDIKAIDNDGIDLDRIKESLDSRSLSDEAKSSFMNHTIDRAEDLTDAGVLKKSDDNSNKYDFVDDKAKEILAENTGASKETISAKNLDAYNSFEKEIASTPVKNTLDMGR